MKTFLSSPKDNIKVSPEYDILVLVSTNRSEYSHFLIISLDGNPNFNIFFLLFVCSIMRLFLKFAVSFKSSWDFSSDFSCIPKNDDRSLPRCCQEITSQKKPASHQETGF